MNLRASKQSHPQSLLASTTISPTPLSAQFFLPRECQIQFFWSIDRDSLIDANHQNEGFRPQANRGQWFKSTKPSQSLHLINKQRRSNITTPLEGGTLEAHPLKLSSSKSTKFRTAKIALTFLKTRDGYPNLHAFSKTTTSIWISNQHSSNTRT